jgi:guanosine-3',5'-bis(diphosphate) 3'-pyrophosphohydrolase
MHTAPQQGQALILEAVAFAAEKHRHQRRKDAHASPYINHPIELAILLEREGVSDPVVLCAALLHDTVEDTETTAAELRAQFGDRIAAVVLEVTDDKALPKQQRKRLQVEHAPSLSREARAVKLADKICNLRDMVRSPPAGWSLIRRQEYLEWAREVIAGLRGDHPRLEAIFDEVYREGVAALAVPAVTDIPAR